MVHIWTLNITKAKGRPECCRAAVREDSIWPRYHQCTRKPKVFREIDGTSYGFCGVHDPEAVEAKNKKLNDQAKLQYQESVRKEEYKKALQVATAASKVALQQIADGHNSPRELAIETLKLFPTEGVSK